MARAWSLAGHHLNLWGEAGTALPVPIKQRISSGEHAAILENPDQFHSLHQKNDYLADCVHTVFGIKDGNADFQGLYFQGNLFTPPKAKEWIQERGLETLVFTGATEGRDTPTVERTHDGQ
jgi:hypothetical protein